MESFRKHGFGEHCPTSTVLFVVPCTTQPGGSVATLLWGVGLHETSLLVSTIQWKGKVLNERKSFFIFVFYDTTEPEHTIIIQLHKVE